MAARTPIPVTQISPTQIRVGDVKKPWLADAATFAETHRVVACIYDVLQRRDALSHFAVCVEQTRIWLEATKQFTDDDMCDVLETALYSYRKAIKRQAQMLAALNAKAPAHVTPFRGSDE